jgi:plastocyanin
MRRLFTRADDCSSSPTVKGAAVFRVSLIALSAALVAAATVMISVASAAPPTIKGTVGPGFTISLTSGGKKVSKLKPGSYKFEISDKSSSHDFHLIGPGVSKTITGVSFVGKKSISVTLKKGTYRFVCDPHASAMKGSFKVA